MALLGAHGEEIKYEFISLPNTQQLAVIYNLLWPLTSMPLCDQRDSILQLRYRRLRPKEQPGLKGHHLMKPMEGDRDETVAETPPATQK